MSAHYIESFIQMIEQQLWDHDSEVFQSYPASRTKLYTDFISAVGYTPNEYVRRRRLSAALSILQASEKSGTEVAYACGYSSHQAFCREMKALFGMTVSEYKKSGIQYYFPPYTGEPVLDLSVRQVTIPKTIELIYESSQLKGIENRAVELFLEQNPYFSGRIFGRNGSQVSAHFYYHIFIEDNSAALPNVNGFYMAECHEEYEILTAIAASVNSEKEINASWDRLYYSWLPVSMYRYAGRETNEFACQYFEEFLYKRGNVKPYRLKLYLPLVKRDGFIKLTIEPYHAQFLTCSESGMDAEKKASDCIIRYMTEKYPYALTAPIQLMRYNNKDVCTCGMRISDALRLKNLPFQLFLIDSLCVILTLDDICDGEEAEKYLEKWISENHIKKKQEPITVYTAKTSGTEMSLICPINSV